VGLPCPNVLAMSLSGDYASEEDIRLLAENFGAVRTDSASGGLNLVSGPYKSNQFAGTWSYGRSSDIQISCRLQGNQALLERNNSPEWLQWRN